MSNGRGWKGTEGAQSGHFGNGGRRGSEAHLRGWNLGRVVGAVVLLLVVVCGCKQTEYVEVPVPIESVREAEVQVDRWKTDTLRDSVFNQVVVKEYVVGDTVHKDSVHVMYKWKIGTKTVYRDSVRMLTDTVRVAVPYKVVEEKKLTKWEKTAIDWFGTLLKVSGALLAVVLMVIVYFVRKIRLK